MTFRIDFDMFFGILIFEIYSKSHLELFCAKEGFKKELIFEKLGHFEN